ncbi:MAG TPA: hypothetical protein VFO91_02230 [Anaerolineales bacterium]|nr:hypothetical protein [Anaerolineales bacterium]
MDDRAQTRDKKAERLVLLLLGGLLIGLATSLPLAVAWPDAMRPPVAICLFGTETNPMERIWVRGRIIPLPCMPTFLFMQPAVWVSFLGAGCVFGLIARNMAERGSRRLLAALGGLSFFLLGYLGTLFVPRIPIPELPLPFSGGVAESFAIMIFGISFVFALVLGLALRPPGLLWRPFVAAAATAVSYWFVTWLLLGRAVTIWTQDPTTAPLAHSLPALGNGMGPMMTTILLANLVAGTIGGCITLALLAVRRSPDREQSEAQRLIPGDPGAGL